MDLRQITLLRRGQPSVNFDAADNCRPYVTLIKAMNFQDGILSTPVDKLKGQCVFVFDLTSTQDFFEKCQYPELVGGALRLNFTVPPEYITELIVLENEGVRLQITSLVMLGKYLK